MKTAAKVVKVPQRKSPKDPPLASSAVWSALAKGTPRHEVLASRVLRRPALLPEVLAGLDYRQACVKFGCAKVLGLVGEQSPAVLLPYWSRWVALLDSDNKVLQWSAMRILGRLAAVASRRRVETLLPRLLTPIRGPVMITAANAMRSATQIALAHPPLAESVAQELLGVEQGQYQTAECLNIALGHAIQTLKQLLPGLKDKAAVIAFARRQLGNSRNATRRKAAAFLKRNAATALAG